MRTRLGLLLVGASLCVAFVHCGGGDDSTGAQPAADAGSDANVPTDSGPIADAGPVDSGPPIVNVNGTLIGRSTDGGTLSGRDVVVIDANDVVTKVTSDNAGGFQVANVQTPYDIGVPYEVADAASPVSPIYYAGMTRPDPIISGIDYIAYVEPDHTARSITVTATVNACVGCTTFIYGTATGQQFPGTGVAAPVIVTYQYFGAAASSSAFHVLITDASGVPTYYADTAVQSFSNGQTVALGTPTLTAVTNKTLSVTATNPAGYTFVGTRSQVFETDHSFTGLDKTYTTLTSALDVPSLPSGVMQISASTNGPNGESSNATVNLPTTTAPATQSLTLYPAPNQIAPADHAANVPPTQVLSWNACTVPTVYSIYLHAGPYTLFAHTQVPSLDIGRLAKAEMALGAATTFTWQSQITVRTDGKNSMDAFTGARAPVADGVTGTNSVTAGQTFTTQ